MPVFVVREPINWHEEFLHHAYISLRDLEDKFFPSGRFGDRSKSCKLKLRSIIKKGGKKQQPLNEKPQPEASSHIKTIKHRIINKLFILVWFTRITNNSTGFPTEQAGPAAPSNPCALGPSALYQSYCCFQWVQESFPASAEVGRERQSMRKVRQISWLRREWTENSYLSGENPLWRLLTRKPPLTLLMSGYYSACSVNGHVRMSCQHCLEL